MKNRFDYAKEIITRPEIEGCRVKAYYCPAGKLSIGFGHTGDDVFEGQEITLEACYNLLDSDLKKFNGQLAGLIMKPMNESQYGAVLSFFYNVGYSKFKKSDLLKDINRADYKSAANEILEWDMYHDDKGVLHISKGLQHRRQLESALFGAEGL